MRAGCSSTWPSGTCTGPVPGCRRSSTGTGWARGPPGSGLAALTTATTGQVTRDTDPGGFCLWAASAGDLVGLDAFYVGKLKGIGPVWQLTGCDTRTRWTIAELIILDAASHISIVTDRQHAATVSDTIIDLLHQSR